MNIIQILLSEKYKNYKKINILNISNNYEIFQKMRDKLSVLGYWVDIVRVILY